MSLIVKYTFALAFSVFSVFSISTSTPITFSDQYVELTDLPENNTIYYHVNDPKQNDNRIYTETTLPEEPVETQSSTSSRKKMVPSDPEKRCPQFEPLFKQYGLTPVDTWSYIAWRESRCRIKAINATWNSKGQMTYHLNSNKSWDSGLLQINSSWVNSVRKVCGVDTGNTRRDLEVLLDIHCNLKFAKWIMDNSSGGLSNWGF